MAIKRGSKVNSSFSSASMTDLMFLLLVFMLIATTLISPFAVKLQLPTSSNQLKEKPFTIVSIQDAGGQYKYYLEAEPISFSDLQPMLKERLAGMEDPTISLHCDKTVPIDEVVKVMNIAKDNKYKLILATSPG